MKSAKADEIFGFASDEIKSTHPPSRRISSNEVGFHRRRRFHPPVRVDLIENDRFLSESVVFWWAIRDSVSRDLRGGGSRLSMLPRSIDSLPFPLRVPSVRKNKKAH